MDFVKKNPCSIPLLFLLLYGTSIIIWVSNYQPTINFWARGLGIITFLNIFTQIMLGSYRTFFNQHYNARKIYLLHNYSGFITLIIGLIHGLIKAWQIGLTPVLLLNSSLAVNLGTIGLYLMLIIVPISDLKYIFKLRINNKFWRITHLLNYFLFPIIYAHSILIGTDFKEPLMQNIAIALLSIVIITIGYRIYKTRK